MTRDWIHLRGPQDAFGGKEERTEERRHKRNSWTWAWWVEMTSEGKCRAFPGIWTDLGWGWGLGIGYLGPKVVSEQQWGIDPGFPLPQMSRVTGTLVCLGRGPV